VENPGLGGKPRLQCVASAMREAASSLSQTKGIAFSQEYYTANVGQLSFLRGFQWQHKE